MLVDDLLTLFRSEMHDLALPQLWSDDEFYLYLDDAQKMFCRRTDNIGDATTEEVVNIDVVPDTEWYSLHPTILKIRDCNRADNGDEVTVVNKEDMPKMGMRFDGKSGPVKAIVTGMESRKVRVWPRPTETVTLNLLVFRLPLLTVLEGDNELEVEDQYHLGLMHWVKHKAYSKQDAEAFDKTKAADFEQKFYAYCAEAQVEQRRLRHKTRVVAYGGI